jgi:hypothetical protein
MSIFINGRKGAWAALMAAALMMTGCALYVDAGPDPAYLKVNIKTSVNDAKIKDALAANHLHLAFPAGGLFHEIRGPFWDWGAYLLAQDGSLRDLRPVSGGPLRRVQGKNLAGSATFALPPGIHKVRILIQVYMEHDFYESDGLMPARPSTETIFVQGFSRDMAREIGPGQTLTVNFPSPK